MNLTELFEKETEGDVSRRDLLYTTAKASLSVGLLGAFIAGCGGSGNDNNNGFTDVDILNFALNLEYLEAEFYAYAVTGASGLDASEKNGTGASGATTGGSQVDFSDGEVQAIATQIMHDEILHVRYLRSALGNKAVAKPAIKLDALGIGFASKAEFLALARAFEDVGVSAYAGAAGLIKLPAYTTAAAQILATEAYHAGNVRLLCVQKGVPTSALDGKDIPPRQEAYFPVQNSDALAIKRSTAEVLDIVYAGANAEGGFYPNGLNGYFTTQ